MKPLQARITQSETPDSRLIERCLGNDQNAWEQLIHRYQRLVYSVARNLCPLPQDTADVFQLVWFDAYRGLERLRNVQALPAWLITMTRRHSMALLRSRKIATPVDSETIPDVEDRISQIEREHMLERAVEQLPERCRRLIELLYFAPDQPSYAEVAQRLDMPVSGIGPNRARCLEKLRRALD